jgi:hypothetical protein
MSYQVIDGINSTDVHSESFLEAMVGSVADALKVPASAVKVSIAHERRNKRALLSSVSTISLISVTSGMTSDRVLNKLNDAILKGTFLASLRARSGHLYMTMSNTTLIDTTPGRKSYSDTDTSSVLQIGTSLHFCVVARYISL